MKQTQRRRALVAGLLALAALTPSPAAQAVQGRFFDLLNEAVRQAQAAKQGQGASAAPQRQIANIWNPQGCAFTDRSPLTLARATRLDRIELWYNWSAREASSAYEIVAANGQSVARGTLSRDSCDPYQAAWCVGADSPAVTLPAGSYTIRVSRARVCQNGASGGQGFIRAWGATVAAPAATRTSTASAPQSLGSRWLVHEEVPGGRYWTAVWTRRKGSNVFDAVWQDSQSGQSFTGTVELRGQAGGKVQLWREATKGSYTGTLSPDGKSIRGSASWYPPGAFWTARIER